MILLAVEKNDYVYVYNENKEKLLSVKGHLHNYSEKFVAIKHLNAEAIDIYMTQMENNCSDILMIFLTCRIIATSVCKKHLEKEEIKAPFLRKYCFDTRQLY